MERWPMPRLNSIKPKPESVGPIQSIETNPDTERREQATQLVETLRTRGWVEMKAPLTDPPIRLFAVCRIGKNPECPNGTIDISHHQALGNFTYGFTEAYIIDLVAEFPKGSGVLTPVGHRDVKIARFAQSDKPVAANGNFAIERPLFKRLQTNTLPQALDSVLKVADDIYGMNGVEVVSEAVPNEAKSDSTDIDTDILADYYKQHNIPLSLSWRGKGFGKLLIGLELELLRQRGVHQLELESISDDLERVFGKFPKKNGRLNVQSLPPDMYHHLISPFLLDQAPLPTSARSPSTRTSTPK